VFEYTDGVLHKGHPRTVPVEARGLENVHAFNEFTDPSRFGYGRRFDSGTR
jgi:hypothetical protein